MCLVSWYILILSDTVEQVHFSVERFQVIISELKKNKRKKKKKKKKMMMMMMMMTTTTTTTTTMIVQVFWDKTYRKANGRRPLGGECCQVASETSAAVFAVEKVSHPRSPKSGYSAFKKQALTGE